MKKIMLLICFAGVTANATDNKSIELRLKKIEQILERIETNASKDTSDLLEYNRCHEDCNVLYKVDESDERPWEETPRGQCHVRCNKKFEVQAAKYPEC